jgi:outer membrane protein assembly factor BamE (lipoprotein component of BamABCDE complex)
MKIRAISTLLMFALAALSAIAAESSFSPKEITAYPFAASPERAAAIQEKYNRVRVSMFPADVKAILGEPDEVRPLYETTTRNAKQIGYTYWYIVRRVTPSGSVNEKQEILVRISFDLNGRVTHVDHWGF